MDRLLSPTSSERLMMVDTTEPRCGKLICAVLPREEGAGLGVLPLLPAPEWTLLLAAAAAVVRSGSAPPAPTAGTPRPHELDGRGFLRFAREPQTLEWECSWLWFEFVTELHSVARRAFASGVLITRKARFGGETAPRAFSTRFALPFPAFSSRESFTSRTSFRILKRISSLTMYWLVVCWKCVMWTFGKNTVRSMLMSLRNNAIASMRDEVTGLCHVRATRSGVTKRTSTWLTQAAVIHLCSANSCGMALTW
mmetsp:Transcript_32184/g.62186  ORF Transcript_32184/g.62186 Transcript_32184/m.62186 type:complete len:253 (+) Transcript_32184:128-886(+)